MFELASLNDLIALKAKYQDRVFPEEHEWGLKQFGTLFCLDQLAGISGRILEVGCGQSRFFDDNFGPEIDYWGLDEPGFYDEEKYRRSAALRKRTTLVDGKLGDRLPELPEAGFDAIFSISVLEHVPPEDVEGVCRDLWRLLKPGGLAVHTLDVAPVDWKKVGPSYAKYMKRAGLKFAKPDVDYSAVAERGLLSEPAAIVFKYYSGHRPEPYVNPRPINQLTCTVKIVARKPG